MRFFRKGCINEVFLIFMYAFLDIDRVSFLQLNVFRFAGLLLKGDSKVSVRIISRSILPKGCSGLHLFTKEGCDVSNRSKDLLSFIVYRLWIFYLIVTFNLPN